MYVVDVGILVVAIELQGDTRLGLSYYNSTLPYDRLSKKQFNLLEVKKV